MSQKIRLTRIAPLITPFERVGLILLILLCALLYFSHSVTVIQVNDSTGYLYGGLRIAETGFPSYYDPLNQLAGPYFTLHAFKVRLGDTDPNFYLNCSPGFPLVVALFRLLIPHPKAIFYASPTMALWGVIGVYALGEALFNARVGLAAAILLAFDPVYFQMATLSRSDAPATATMLWGLALFVSALKGERKGLGLLSGVALGFACLIRYVVVLTLIPLALYLILTYGRSLWAKRSVYGFTLGFGAFALLILLFNRLYYGGFLTTGYSPPHTLNISPPFHPSYFFGRSPVNPGGYVATCRALWNNFRYLLLLAPFALLVVPRRTGIFLTSLALLFPLLFSFYLHAPEGFATRLLLPSFPALYLMVSQLVSRVGEAIVRRRFAVAPLLLAAALLWSLPTLPSSLERANKRNQREISRVALIEEFTSQTEQNAVFLTWRYHDQVILYGHRSAMHFDMIPSFQAKAEQREEEEFEEGVVRVTNTLLGARIPVYWIPDPPRQRPDRCELEPALQAHFQIIPWREQKPVIYRIALK